MLASKQLVAKYEGTVPCARLTRVPYNILVVVGNEEHGERYGGYRKSRPEKSVIETRDVKECFDGDVVDAVHEPGMRDGENGVLGEAELRHNEGAKDEKRKPKEEVA